MTDQYLTLSKQVELKPYISRAFKSYELMTDQEIMNGAGGTLIIDTETYINYFLIAMKDIVTKSIITFEIKGENTFNSDKLRWILRSYRTIGFNSLKYDMPLIWYALILKTLKEIKKLSDTIIYQNVFPQQLEQDFNFKIERTNHIDLIEVCPLRGSLKLYAARLHAKRIQDLPFDVDAAITNDQIEIVKDYCINGDLDATELLFDNLTEQLQLREDLSRQYEQNLMSKSDAQIAESVISSELKRLTGKWPKKPKLDGELFFNYQVPGFISFQTPALQKVLDIIKTARYDVLENGRLNVPKEVDNLQIVIGHCIYRLGSGGLHSSEKNVAIKSNDKFKLFDRDVTGYYPKIVLVCELFPSHLGRDFLTVYKTIVDRRVTAKKAKNIAISECLKITVNGTFGKTGSPYSVLYAPQMMIQITVTGQLALLMLIEQLELNNISVASANTDGVLVYCPQYKEATYRNIVQMWEQLTGFMTEETEYAAFYARDVNAYLAIKSGSKEVKGKNVYYDPWRAKTARDGYWRFQKNPSTQICVEAIERLLIDNISIEKTILECTNITKFVAVKNVKGGAHKNGHYLGKVIRWYYAKDMVGAINYISSNNKVPDSDGAKPCMDLPETFPSDINYEWYVEKAIEMLYDMAYLKRQEQMRLI